MGSALLNCDDLWEIIGADITSYSNYDNPPGPLYTEVCGDNGHECFSAYGWIDCGSYGSYVRIGSDGEDYGNAGTSTTWIAGALCKK